jgi:PAS domain S-box-containing protein
LPEGLFTTDAQGRIESWNSEAERLTGWTREQAIGQTCQLLAGDAIHGCQCDGGPIACSLAKRGRSSKTCTLGTRDGRLLRIVKNAVPIVDEHGTPTGALETFTAVGEVTRDPAAPWRGEACEGAFRMVGRHAGMHELFKTIALIARSDATVMILGESGTRKECVASAIHHASSRANGPFVRVNCSALNEGLLESELFGHVKGAFTGALKDRRGRFEEAHGGTLLLDEIGDLSAAVQVKLLRAIEEREIERVGDSRPIKIDVRLLCATHRDLKALVQQERFRADLYFRLAVFPLYLPALRERGEDVELLAETFLASHAGDARASTRRLTQRAVERLRAHSWPGNVRELHNVLEYAALRDGDAPIGPEHLPPHFEGEPVRVGARSSAPPRHASALGEEPRVPAHELSQDRILAVLDACGGNRAEAARRLRISRVTLWKRLKAIGGEKGEPEPSSR